MIRGAEFDFVEHRDYNNYFNITFASLECLPWSVAQGVSFVRQTRNEIAHRRISLFISLKFQ